MSKEDGVIDSWTAIDCPKLLISGAGEKKIRIKVLGNYYRKNDKVIQYSPEPTTIIWETEFDVPEKVINMAIEVERIFDEPPTNFKCQCCGTRVK